jgi:hypothetical protein
MPKAPAKKMSKSIKSKPAPKGSKPKTKKPAKKAVAPVPERGFMWKILKQKQADKNNPNKPQPQCFAEDRFKNYSREPSFTKFAGPRRRAG